MSLSYIPQHETVRGCEAPDGACVGRTVVRRTVAALALALGALLAAPASAATLTRGPYLQVLTTTGVTVVWNTDVPSACTLSIHAIGGDPTVLPGPTDTVCAIPVTGLVAGTEYGYTPLSDGVPLGDESSFRTDQPDGAFTLLVVGDSGTGDANQLAVRDLMLQGPADVMLHTGDMVYDDGEPANYNPRFFTPYADLVRRLVFWPCLGDHDDGTDLGAPWRDAFYTPANNAAGTENYYSFDFANAHVVVLDINESTAPGSDQYNFLDQDLASTSAVWKFVALHYPAYSSGTVHGSDTILRANLVPLFDRYGVDLVFNGHEHNYERTLPLRGDLIVAPDAGTVYITTGGGGRELYPVGTSAFTAYSESAFHFTRVTVAGNTLREEMVRVDGATPDVMVLSKGPSVAGTCSAPIVVPSEGGAFEGTTSGTSADGGTCGGGAAPEQVFEWTPTVSGRAIIQTCSTTLTAFDTVLYMRSDSCAGNQIACNDDTGGCGTIADGASPHTGSKITPIVTAGVPYFIVVDGYGNNGGNFDLTVIPPDEDVTGTCSVPTVIPAEGGVFTATTSGAGNEIGSCGGASSSDWVFQWTPDKSGLATIETCNVSMTDFDTVLYVRGGSCEGTELACNDDTTGCGIAADDTHPHRGSRVRVAVTAGEAYWLVVDGYNGANGDFALTVTPPTDPTTTTTSTTSTSTTDTSTSTTETSSTSSTETSTSTTDTSTSTTETSSTSSTETSTSTTATSSTETSTSTTESTAPTTSSTTTSTTTEPPTTSSTSSSTSTSSSSSTSTSSSSTSTSTSSSSTSTPSTSSTSTSTSSSSTSTPPTTSSTSSSTSSTQPPTTSSTSSTTSSTSTTAPGSGTCGTPLVIPATGGSFTGTTSGTSARSGSCASETAGAPEQVFAWTPAASGVATIGTCSPETLFDTVIYVRTGTCAGGQEVACNDDAASCGTGDSCTPNNGHHGSLVNTTVTAGQTYYIVVDGFAGSCGGSSGNFRLTVTAPGAPATTSTTTSSSTSTSSTTSSTSSTSSSSTSSTTSSTSSTSPSSTSSTTSSTSSTSSSSTSSTTSSTSSTSSSSTSTTSTSLPPTTSTTSSSTSSTSPTTSSTSTTTPPSGTCGSPLLLPAGGGTFTGTTSGASTMSGSCASETGTAPERVFAWTPAASGVATIGTCGTNTRFDTAVYVRTGGCAAGSEIACNDDTATCGTGDSCVPNNGHHGSLVTPTVTAGQTYYIIVDGFAGSCGGASGAFSLTVTPPTVPTTTTTSTVPSTTSSTTSSSTSSSTISTTTTSSSTSSSTIAPTTSSTTSTSSSTTIRTTTTISTSTTSTTLPACGAPSAIAFKFNDATIDQGKVIWFSSVVEASGLSSTRPVRIHVDHSTIQFSAGSVSYTLNVPDADVIFSPTATVATTTFDAARNTWMTTVPSSLGGGKFLAGLAFRVPVALPKQIDPVTWQGQIRSDTPGVTASWKWAAAVYSSFGTDYTTLGVKPVDDGHASAYQNGDHAGTPENFKTLGIKGATGDGNSPTGSYSAKVAARCP